VSFPTLLTVIGLDVDIFFLLYLGSGFVLLFGLWFYYDWRDQYLFEGQRTKVVYHCIKCSQIYTGAHGSEECDCPQCGFTNGRLRF
jgi:rubredoxin